jgi:hypothetical protein
MDMKENFESQYNGFKNPMRGSCLTIAAKVPPSLKMKTDTLEACISLCNVDDSCSGLSYDINNVCTIYNPSVGGDPATSNAAIKGTPLTKSTNDSDNSMCLIKDQIASPNYNIFVGKCLTETSGTPNFSTAYPISYKLCSDACNADPQCNGYNYDSTGGCTVYNPTIYQISGDDVINPLVQGDNNSENNSLCYIKKNQLNNVEVKDLSILNNNFQSPLLTPTVITPNPINYNLSGWNVSYNPNFIDIGYWNGDVNNTIFPMGINMSVATLQTIRFDHNGGSNTIQINVPANLVGNLTNDYFYSWFIWAINFAKSLGVDFNVFAFQNGFIYFGIYGYRNSVSNVERLFRYNNVGKYTGTIPSSQLLIGSGNSYSRVFIHKDLKKFIDSFSQVFNGSCRTATGLYPPYIDRNIPFNDCNYLCMNDTKCQAINYRPNINNSIQADKIGHCQLFDYSVGTNAGNAPSGTLITKGDSTVGPLYTCFLLPSKLASSSTLSSLSSTSSSTSSSSASVSQQPDTFNKYGVIIYNNKQYAFLKPNIVLEQTIQNEIFEEGIYYLEADLVNPNYTTSLVTCRLSSYVVDDDGKEFLLGENDTVSSQLNFRLLNRITTRYYPSSYLKNKIKIKIDTINSLNDVYIDRINLRFYKQKSTTSSVNPTTISMPTNYTTLDGQCRTYDSKYPVYASNINISQNACATMCNNDLMCSGYTYSQDSTKTCILYNYTFNSSKGTVDTETTVGSSVAGSTTAATQSPYLYYTGYLGNITYNPVSTSTGSIDINYKCFIKNNTTPSNYQAPKGGLCSTVSRTTTVKKYVPSISARVSYNTCVAACNNDTKCSGFSYKNDGTCTLHDPSLLPNQIFNTTSTGTTTTTTTSVNRSPTGSRLVDGDGAFFTNCYIKMFQSTTTSSTNTTTTRSNTTTSSTSSAMNLSNSNTTSSTTTSTRNTTTTRPTPTTTIIPTFTANNMANISLVSSNVIDIAVSSQIEQVRYDEIISQIINIINPNNTYKITQTYVATDNLFLIKVNNYTTVSSAESFKNESFENESFENSFIGLKLRIIYENNIQTVERPAINKLLALVIKPNNNSSSITATSTATTTEINKGALIGGIIGGILLVLIIIGIVIYFKYKKNAD